MAEQFVLTAQLNTQLNVASVQATIRQLRSQLQGTTVNLNVTGAAKVNKQMQQVAATTEKVTKNVKQGRDMLGDFGKAGALAAKRFAAFSIATAGFIAFVSAIKNGAKAAIDFERQMIRISQVTGVSMHGLKDLKGAITDLSTSLGVSSEKLVDISRVLAQTGMSARDTKIALEALAKTELAPTFTNIQKTTEAAIAAMRQFNIEAGKLEQTLGQMNALAANFAVEADDLGVVIRRAGGAFKSAGGSLLELEALFTSVRSTTRESAETIATGFRTIFTRMRRPKTIMFLKELGVSLEDMTGKFVGPYEAVRRLNAALSELDPRDTRYAQIIEELGGFRQVSKVIPLIQQFEKAELARATAIRGSTSLTKDALSAQDALAIRLMKLKESFAELMRQIMDNKGIQLFIDMSLRLAEALLKIAKALEPLIPLIGILGASALFKGGGRLLAGAKGGLGFAKGGMVPGTGNTDSVPAMLTPGEFVVRKSVASRMGAGQLNEMNRYAAGGVVRKGRSGYGTGTATFKVGSTAKPKVGAFFMLPDEKDTVSRKGVGAGVPFDKLNRSSKKLLNRRTGRPAGDTEEDWKWAKNHKIKIQAPKAQMLLGPPESKDIKEATEAKSREAIADISKTFLEKFKDIGGKASPEGKKTVANVDFKSIAGHIFEGIISTVTGAMLEGGGAGWDYKSPIPWEKLDILFGSTGKSKQWQKSVVAMDAKRTKGATANVSLNTKVTNAFKTAQKGKASNVTMRDMGVRSKDIGLEGINMVSSETSDALSKKAASRPPRAGQRGGPRATPVRRGFGYKGGGIVDSVPALLTPGEFVVNKASAQAIGYGNLKGMNKYAAGGIVRKGRGNYGSEGGGMGGGLGMLFAADMAMGFAATLVDAESKFGAFLDTIIKVTTAFMAFSMIMKQGNVAKKADIAATKMTGQTGSSTGVRGGHGPKGTPIITPGGLQQKHVAPGRMWSPGGKVMPESITPSQPRGVPGQVVDAPGKWNKAKRMMGEKNARRLGRAMAWTSDKVRKAGVNMEKFGGRALIVGMLLGQLGDMIKGAGMAELQKTGGESGGAMAVAGGALSAAAMGGAAGMMVGGLPGAAIGALGGALYGLVNTISEVNTALEKIAVDKGMESLNIAFRDVQFGWSELASMGPQVESSLAALNEGMAGSAETQAHAAQQIKQSMPKYMKAIKAFAAESDTMDAFFSRMDEGSLKTFARLNKLPYDKLKKDIENQIQANKDAAEAARALKDSHLELERIERSMTVIDRSVAGASSQIEDFGRAIDASMKTIKRPDLSAGVLSRPSGLTEREMDSGGRLDQQLAALTSVLPKREVTRPLGSGSLSMGRMVTQQVEPELATSARENIKALSALDSALIKTRSVLGENIISGEKAFSTFENELRTGGKGLSDAAIKSIMSGLRGTFKEDEFGKAVREPSERGKIKQAAERDLKRQLETLKRIGKYIEQASKEMQKAFDARTKLEQELVKELGKLVDLQKQRFATMKKIRGQGKVTPDESERFFQKKQAARLGAVGEGGLAAGGQVDVAQLGGRYRELNKRIMDTTAQMNKFGGGLQAGESELDKRIRLNDQIADDTSKLKALGIVIADYQNVQQRTAALQEKINQLNQQAAKRRTMVDQYAGATDEARAEMDRVADMARRIADGTEQFANVPQEMRGQVISFVQDMASQGGPIGDKFKGAAGDIRVQTARDMGIKLTPDMEKQLREQPTSEVEKLGKEIDRAFQDAIGLQTDAIIAGVTDQQAVLNTALEALKTVITDALPRALAEQTKDDNNALKGELQRQTGILIEQLAVLRVLADLGVDVEDPVAIREAKRAPQQVKDAAKAKTLAMLGRQAETTSQNLDSVQQQRIAGGKLSAAHATSSGQRKMFQFQRGAGSGSVSQGEDLKRAFSVRDIGMSVIGQLQHGPTAAFSGTTMRGGTKGDRRGTRGDWLRSGTGAGGEKQRGKRGEAAMFLQDVKKSMFVDMLEKLVRSGEKTIGAEGGQAGGKDISRKMIMKLDEMTKFLAGTGTSEDVLNAMVKEGIIGEGQQEGFNEFLGIIEAMKDKVEADRDTIFNSQVLLTEIRQQVTARSGVAAKDAKNLEESLERSFKTMGITGEADKERFRALAVEESDEGRAFRKGLEGLGDDQTLSGTESLIQGNQDAMNTLNTTNASLDKTIQTLNQRLDAVGAGGKRASIDNSGRGTPGELRGMTGGGDMIVKNDLADPTLQDSANKALSTPGSGYVHDVKVEAAIKAKPASMTGGIGEALDPLKGMDKFLNWLGLPSSSGAKKKVDDGGAGGEKAGEQPGDGRKSRKTVAEYEQEIRERHGLTAQSGGGGGGAARAIPPTPLPASPAGAGVGTGSLGPAWEGMPTWYQNLWSNKPPIPELGAAERAGAKMGLGTRVAGDMPGTGIAPGGGRPGGGRPGGITPTAGEGAGKGMGGGAPDMDKWTKSMTSLGTQMGAFTEAFQGGMIWKIEGTHDINVNLNGAEVFGTLTEMFESYVLGKTGSAIKNWLKEHMPEKGIMGSVGSALGGVASR